MDIVNLSRVSDGVINKSIKDGSLLDVVEELDSNMLSPIRYELSPNKKMTIRVESSRELTSRDINAIKEVLSDHGFGLSESKCISVEYELKCTKLKPVDLNLSDSKISVS